MPENIDEDTPGIVGISVGWLDQYSPNYEGQSATLGDLCSGDYILYARLNQGFHETDVDNQAVELPFTYDSSANNDLRIENTDGPATMHIHHIGEHYSHILAYNMASNIIVPKGSKLEIHGSVMNFAPGKGIIVEAGGELLVKNSALSAIPVTSHNQECMDGTWKGIVTERAKRIQEAKEAAAAEHRRKIQEAKEFEEMMKQIVLVASVVVISIGLFVFLFKVVL